MKWTHIMDEQPDHGSLIVQVILPFEGDYIIGMRKYVEHCTFSEYLNFCKENQIPYPDFWWIYAEDFLWPQCLVKI